MVNKRYALVAAGALVLAGLAVSTSTATATPGPTPGLGNPAPWCEQHGGAPAIWEPYYGNSPATGLQLGGERMICTFTSADGKTRIMISADTLAADKPTLAALAYVRKPKPVDGSPNLGQPARTYCWAIGGTPLFGRTGNDVGGWRPKDAPERGTGTCTFADGSIIDEWGLFYHYNGIIRGADLADKFKATIPPA